MSRASEAVLLKDHLKELRLPAMRRDYAECARQARETRASYEGFLLDLVSRQLEQRRANQLERRLKQARFPVMKTLEKTDLDLLEAQAVGLAKERQRLKEDFARRCVPNFDLRLVILGLAHFIPDQFEFAPQQSDTDKHIRRLDFLGPILAGSAFTKRHPVRLAVLVFETSMTQHGHKKNRKEAPPRSDHNAPSKYSHGFCLN